MYMELHVTFFWIVSEQGRLAMDIASWGRAGDKKIEKFESE